MLKALKRILWSFISLAAFLTIINLVNPPLSWQQASIFQILAFFIPLFIFLTMFCHIFIRQLAISFIIASSLIITLVLQAIKELNYISGCGVLIFTILSLLLYRRFNHQSKISLNKPKPA